MINAILGVIGMIIYPLFSIFFVFVDLLQSLFYVFAGIGDVRFGNTPISGNNDGGENSTGLLYYLLNTDVVKNILISMTILALFLLVIFTTLAFLKSIYAEKPKSWKDILSSAVKGLVNFVVLPVCCLLGVWVGNIILQAVNGATSTGGSTMLSRKLFICCAYNANVYRGESPKNDGGKLINDLLDKNDWLKKEVGISSVDNDKESEYYAEVLDQLFAVSTKDGKRLGITLYTDVNQYYTLYEINYLILIVGGLFMSYVMVNVTYGMIKRIFILLMLFVVSPALCAMYPLDDGAVVKTWTGDVKKNILSAYGAVAGMNLMFSFLPLIQNINLVFPWQGVGDFFLNSIIQLLLLICALFCMNDFISMITGYVGGNNAFGDGKSLRGQTQGALKKYGKATVEKGVKVGGAFVRGAKSGWETAHANGQNGVGSFFAGVGLGAAKGLGGALGRTAAETGTSIWNALDKSASDTLGLKHKDVGVDNLAKKGWKGAASELFGSTGLGQAISDDGKARKDATYEAEQKKLKKDYENSFKSTGKNTVVDTAGNFIGGTTTTDAKGTMTDFNSGLLTELDKAENAGISQEEFVKLVHNETGVGEDAIRERIKADKKLKRKADENVIAIDNYDMENKYKAPAAPTAQTQSTSELSDETIGKLSDALKDAVSKVFNGQSNTGTAAQTGTFGAQASAQLQSDLTTQLRTMTSDIVSALGRLQSEVKTTGDEQKAKYSAETTNIIEGINSLKRSLRDNSESTGADTKDIAEVIRLLNKIVSNLK